ncbi:class I SAM-dependent methyltransferase [Neorhizobium galegae]|uniref:class I SAM-dependent methyltransferase n=1 Tax=Neorhizobium galegae TaxID=399 RepID=UPI000621CD0E|nr:class I SAM-dependent methyltransferase [Neorhizobium galegae]KAB1121164.1 class I SAM-dependent methyltransferase [Neorhizobium galegae]MCQ1807428.1 class I SAM-dependent methyltransferase [Neorhizobium galegae]CDZ61596.1 SAM-dependent methyltransferase [Neorhizobium galegae bv. orientalis]
MSLDSHLPAYKSDFAYQFDNEIILNWYPRRIMALTEPSNHVLELGIGHGYSCNHFSEYFESYTVIDGSESVISNFREVFPSSKAEIVEGFFEDFSSERKFDIIIMGFVLEHVAQPADILRKYRELMVPGGRCFVSVPNAESLHRRFGAAAGLLDNVLALGEGDLVLGHRRYYTVDSLTTELEEAGYSILRKEGIFLKPITTKQMISLELGRDIIDGMCKVAVDYPELSAGLLFEATSNK